MYIYVQESQQFWDFVRVYIRTKSGNASASFFIVNLFQFYDIVLILVGSFPFDVYMYLHYIDNVFICIK